MVCEISPIVNLDYHRAKPQANKHPVSLKDLYLHYFVHEQEGDSQKMATILKQAVEIHKGDHPIIEILKARRQMFFAQAAEPQSFPRTVGTPEGDAYLLFLQGAYWDRRGDQKKAVASLEASSNLFDKAGNPIRGLTSQAHAQKNNLANLEYLQKFARESKIPKAQGIVNLELAQNLRRRHQYRSAKGWALEAEALFSRVFLDPQRCLQTRLLLAELAFLTGNESSYFYWLQKLPPHPQGHSGITLANLKLRWLCHKIEAPIPKPHSLERRLMMVLLQGPSTVRLLKELLWPEQTDLSLPLIDDRFRSLCFEMRRKYKVSIQRKKCGTVHLFTNLRPKPPTPFVP